MNGFSVTSDFLCAPTSEPTLNLSVCAGTSQVPAFLSPAAAMTFPKKHKKKKDRKSLPEADVAVSVLGFFFIILTFLTCGVTVHGAMASSPSLRPVPLMTSVNGAMTSSPTFMDYPSRV